MFATHVGSSRGRPVRQYVAVVRTEAGQTFRSIPFADYETAAQVVRFSRLDADVVEAHVEEVLGRDEDGAEERRC